MKLGALNSAIRNHKEVRVPLYMPGSGVEWVKVQKTDLLEMLKGRYGNARSEEVALSVDAEGHVLGFAWPESHHCVRNPAPQPAAEPLPDIDLDDLLGEAEPNVELEDLLG